MNINTERLELIPLLHHQLRLWVEGTTQLEKELNITNSSEIMDDFFSNIVKGQIDITEKDSDNYLWHSFWLLVRSEDRVMVGSADFKDVPNKNGEVEIGYGLCKRFEHNGYMTEAVKAMCKWALTQPHVGSVIAETEKDNFPSQHILERCGFKNYAQGQTLWWRL